MNTEARLIPIGAMDTVDGRSWHVSDVLLYAKGDTQCSPIGISGLQGASVEAHKNTTKPWLCLVGVPRIPWCHSSGRPRPEPRRSQRTHYCSQGAWDMGGFIALCDIFFFVEHS